MPGTALLTDNFADLTNWTVTGTANAVSNEAVITPGNAGLNASGMILASPIVPNGYTSFKFEYKPTSLTNCNFMMGLITSSSLNYGSGAVIYVSGNSGETYAVDSGGVVVLDGSYTTVADWQELYIEVLGNDYLRFYLEGDLVFTTYNIGSGHNVCGVNQYLMFGVDKVDGVSGTLNIRNFEVYDNRLISIEQDQVEIDTVAMGVEAYSATGLDAGTAYDYRLRHAYGEAGYQGVEYSDYTDEETATTDSDSTADLSSGSSALNIRNLRRRPFNG